MGVGGGGKVGGKVGGSYLGAQFSVEQRWKMIPKFLFRHTIMLEVFSCMCPYKSRGGVGWSISSSGGHAANVLGTCSP